MNPATELRAEADHLRALARGVTDRSLLAKIVELAVDWSGVLSKPTTIRCSASTKAVTIE
jgi:hypothetical protein